MFKEFKNSVGVTCEIVEFTQPGRFPGKSIVINDNIRYNI